MCLLLTARAALKPVRSKKREALVKPRLLDTVARLALRGGEGLSTPETVAVHAKNIELLRLYYVDNLMVHHPGDCVDTSERSNPARRQEEWLALAPIYKKAKRAPSMSDSSLLCHEPVESSINSVTCIGAAQVAKNLPCIAKDSDFWLVFLCNKGSYVLFFQKPPVSTCHRRIVIMECQ